MGAGRLAGQLEGLLTDPARRQALGRFGREVVCERFSLARAVQLQLDIYQRVVQRPPAWRLRDVLRSSGRALMLELRNHDPRAKRGRRLAEHHLFAAARQGVWPPAVQP